MTAQQKFIEDYREEVETCIDQELIAPTMVAKLHTLFTSPKHKTWMH